MGEVMGRLLRKPKGNPVLRSILFGLVLCVGFSPGLAGQDIESEMFLASAEVIQAISVVGLRDLEFGDLVWGSTVTVNPEDVAAGSFQVSATPGSEVNLEFTQWPKDLELIQGIAAKPPHIHLSLTAIIGETNDPSQGEDFDDKKHGTDYVMPELGILYLWVGGTVDPHDGQSVVGWYQATVELTASYVGN